MHCASTSTLSIDPLTNENISYWLLAIITWARTECGRYSYRWFGSFSLFHVTLFRYVCMSRLGARILNDFIHIVHVHRLTISKEKYFHISNVKNCYLSTDSYVLFTLPFLSLYLNRGNFFSFIASLYSFLIFHDIFHIFGCHSTVLLLRPTWMKKKNDNGTRDLWHIFYLLVLNAMYEHWTFNTTRAHEIKTNKLEQHHDSHWLICILTFGREKIIT